MRATAVMVGEDGAGGLRRPIPMSAKLDVYDSQHEARCKEDMLRFGKLLSLLLDEKILGDNDSLRALRDQLLAEEADSRPDAESVEAWIESVLEDLGGPPSEPPKFASSRHPFYGYIDLITQESVEDDDLEGYDSDDSFLPSTRAVGDQEHESTRSDEGEFSVGSNDTASDTASSSGVPRTASGSRLNLFLAENSSSSVEEPFQSRRRSASDDMGSPDTDNSKNTSMIEGLLSARHARRPSSGKFRPLSSATKNNFRQSWDKRQTRKMSMAAPSPKRVAEKFDRQERISEEEASALISQAEQVLRRESNVLDINDSLAVQVFGDIHGQYFDLRHALQESGYSLDDDEDHPSRTIVFLGDYVDRGAWSCEVLFFLLALKIARPSRVFLLRGNHECGAVVSFFGFKDEIETKYGMALFHRCIVCFQAMPLCAVVSTAQTKWMLCHGGISPKLDTLEDVKAVNRFAEPGMNGLFCDLLWADPLAEKDQEEHLEFTNNPSRGCSVRFGRDALVRFLDRNAFTGLIRGHEVMEEGVAFQYDNRVVTVFSAPNYCGRYGNRAAYLMIEHDGAEPLKAFKYDPAPNQPEPATFDSVTMEINSGIATSIPFMPTTLIGFVNRALQLWSATAIKEAQDELSRQNSEKAGDLKSEGVQSASKTMGGLSSVFEARRSLNEEDESDVDDEEEDEDHEAEKVEQYDGEDIAPLPKEARKPISPFMRAKKKLSRALKKMASLSALSSRFQTAKFADGINEAHPELTQLKLQSAEIKARMRISKHASESNLLGEYSADSPKGEVLGILIPKRYSDLSNVVVTDNLLSGTNSPTKVRFIETPKSEEKPTSVIDSSVVSEQSGVEMPSFSDANTTGEISENATEEKPLAVDSSVVGQIDLVNEDSFDAMPVFQLRSRGFESLPSHDFVNVTDDADGLTTLPSNGLTGETNDATGESPVKMPLVSHATDGEINALETRQDTPVRFPLVSHSTDGEIHDLEIMKDTSVKAPLVSHSTDGEINYSESVKDTSVKVPLVKPQTTDGQVNVLEKDHDVVPSEPILESMNHPNPLDVTLDSVGGQVSAFADSNVPNPSAFDTSFESLLSPRNERFNSTGRESGNSIKSPRTPFGGQVSFSETELRNLHLLFLLVDRSDDGKISAEEIMAWSLDEGERVSEEDAQRVVEAVDADQDGFIGLDDWLWFAHCCRELWLEESSDAKGGVAAPSPIMDHMRTQRVDSEVPDIF